jgi:hypothetical protein
MDFIQHRTSIKYLFTQNRFLNTIDPGPDGHLWRWQENECSVHYDSDWTILKWDLEPPWYQCPYIAPLSARSLDIVATREIPQDPQAAAERGSRLLEDVKQEDWFRFADTPPYMTVRHNRLVTDVTMTGALFKLWESIRLSPTAEAVFALLRYLETLLHGEHVAFEETRYYQQLFLKMAETGDHPEFGPYLSALREWRVEPSSKLEKVGETQDYNFVSLVFTVGTATEQSLVKKYYAIAKAWGPVDIFRERLAEREVPGLLWMSDTLEEVIEKTKASELGQKSVTLEGDMEGYNIIGTQSGYLAVAQSLGPTGLFQERIGERELYPIVLKAGTREEIRERIKQMREQERAPRSSRLRRLASRLPGASRL